MRRREASNEWDGFDSQVEHYDEKEEKRYQSRIWWCLALIGCSIILITVFRQVKEAYMARTYQVVEAEYVADKPYLVKYTATDGIKRYYQLPEHSVRMKDGKVLLYYENDDTQAFAIGTFKSWILYYIFFGSMTGLSVYKLIRIYGIGKKDN